MKLSPVTISDRAPARVPGAAFLLSSALLLFRSLREKSDSTYEFGESELNELGYHLLGAKRFPDAIEILKLNAEQYASSSNAYDGLGEAYMDDGNKELAARNYKRSLELDPGNSIAALMLKKLGGN